MCSSDLDEVAREGVVGDDAADAGGGEENVFRPLGGEEPLDGVLARQVELAAAAHDDVSATFGAQPADDGRAHQAAMSRDINTAVGLQNEAFNILAIADGRRDTQYPRILSRPPRRG